MKLGRNDPCWCGSGRKFKRCHLDREQQESVTFEEILRGQKAAAGLRLCLANEIDSTPCRGGIAQAHSLSRSASLERIARNQHVYGFRGSFADLMRARGKLAPRLIGIRKASTFTGFCEGHDSELFRPVDAQPLIPTVEQLGLLAYRSLCREIVGKMVLGRSLPLMRTIDRGKSKLEQVITQINANRFTKHVDSTLPHLVREQKTWHEVIRQSAYERVSYALIRFQETPEVVCSGVCQPDQDFADRVLLDLWQPGTRQDNVAFALVPADTGGFAFLGWLDEFKEAEEFVQSLLDLPESRITSQLVRYAFETFDNVWLSPSWWETLPEPEREFLIERMFTGNVPYRGDSRDPYSLHDNGMSFVHWGIRKVEKVFRRKAA